MKEGYLYQQQEEQKAQCLNCAHKCVIAPDKKGVCGVRQNIDGKIYSLTYNKVCAINIDPIEKKPFFHFLPGTDSLSMATVGCQFACHSCQNWQISQEPKLTGEVPGEEKTPEKIVQIAKQYNVPSISYTYTDPIVFSEYALETMELARGEGIKNNWVTSGFLSDELIEMVAPYLDAANVDLKGYSEDFYARFCAGRRDPVLNTLKKLKEKDVWVEVTTLVIPSLNDSEENLKQTAEFIKNELGAETPWHISRFSGTISWKLSHLPDTPIETLQKTYEMAKELGLKYVYIGNVPGVEGEDTFCPNCGEKMIDRTGYSVKRYDEDGECAECGQSLSIVE